MTSMIISMILSLISVLAVSDPNYAFQLCFGLVVLVYKKTTVLCLGRVTGLQLHKVWLDWGELSYVTLWPANFFKVLYFEWSALFTRGTQARINFKVLLCRWNTLICCCGFLSFFLAFFYVLYVSHKLNFIMLSSRLSLDQAWEEHNFLLFLFVYNWTR